MLCFLKCLYAYDYLLITDRTKKPINSTVAFKTVYDRLLYDFVMKYMDLYQKTDSFWNTMGSIYTYIQNIKDIHHSLPQLCAIKLLYAASVTNVFYAGSFNIQLLDLGKDFDEYLVYHWHIICQYDLQVVFNSAKKEIRNYEYVDFAINKSLSYVTQAYTSVLHQTITLQLTEERMSWSECNKFFRLISRRMPNTYMVQKILLNDENKGTYLDFKLDDFTDQKSIIFDTISWSYTEDRKGTNIILDYSALEILDLLSSYNDIPTELANSNQANSYMRLQRMILRNQHIMRFFETILSFAVQKRIMMPKLIINHPSKFEYFFYLGADVDDEKSFAVWQDDSITIRDEILAIDILITNWIRLLHE